MSYAPERHRLPPKGPPPPSFPSTPSLSSTDISSSIPRPHNHPLDFFCFPISSPPTSPPPTIEHHSNLTRTQKPQRTPPPPSPSSCTPVHPTPSHQNRPTSRTPLHTSFPHSHITQPVPPARNFSITYIIGISIHNVGQRLDAADEEGTVKKPLFAHFLSSFQLLLKRKEKISPAHQPNPHLTHHPSTTRRPYHPPLKFHASPLPPSTISSHKPPKPRHKCASLTHLLLHRQHAPSTPKPPPSKGNHKSIPSLTCHSPSCTTLPPCLPPLLPLPPVLPSLLHPSSPPFFSTLLLHPSSPPFFSTPTSLRGPLSSPASSTSTADTDKANTQPIDHSIKSSIGGESGI